MRDTHSLDRSPLLGSHIHHVSAWWDRVLFIVLSTILTAGQSKYSSDELILPELLHQAGICSSDLSDQ